MFYTDCKFSALYLKSSDCNSRQNLIEGFVREKQFLPPSHTNRFPHKILVNFDIFQTAVKYFLKHYLARISFLIHDRQFEPLNAQEKDLMRV